MGRKAKLTVDYFPHFVADSKTKRTLARYWQNDGYAFWFKMLELLCSEDGHFLDLSTPAEWEDFLNFTLVESDTALGILNKLVELGKIDVDLWEQDRVIWCQSLLDNLKFVYDKRTVPLPMKPDLRGYPGRKSTTSGISGTDNPQSKVEDIREEQIIPKENRDTPLTPHSGGTTDSEAQSGESLLVETATDEPEQGNPSMTRKPRERKRTGVLTKAQQTRFDHFWEAYPNKKSPGQAEATFAKLDPDDDLLKEILAGIARAKKYDHRFREVRFTPYPSSWLNSKGWKDTFEEGGGSNGEHRQHIGESDSGFTPSTGFRKADTQN